MTVLSLRRQPSSSTAAPTILLPQAAMLGNVARSVAVRTRAVLYDRLDGAPRLEVELADMSMHDCEPLLSEQEPQRQPQIGDLAFS
jgi:hypothetical protein